MKLSILVPVYNERTVVERSLAQVLAAPLPENMDREIIIVDDCSTDGTSAILDRIAAADPRIRLVRHPVNRGKGAAVRTAIQIGLRQNQFRVLEATTARAGLEMLKSHRIDLVLCDFHLGGIDEVGGFAALRESAARAGVRFLGMTGESQLAEQQRNVLVKPFSLATLLRVIEETLAKDVEPFVRGEPAPGKNHRKNSAGKLGLTTSTGTLYE